VAAERSDGSGSVRQSERQVRSRRRSRRVARRSWYLAAAAVLLGWNAAILLGYAAYLLMFEWCPVQSVVEGQCREPWFARGEEVVRITSAAAAPLFAIGLAMAVRPSRPVIIAWVVFAATLMFALFFGWAAETKVSLIAVAAAGIAAVVLVTWLLRNAGDVPEER
jgi:hypothetical protein